MTFAPDELAAEMLAARAERRTLTPLTDRMTLSLDDAYAVQRAGLRLRIARGERQVGWKLGYTSAAMREQMRVDAPNFGPLTDVMRVGSGAVVGDRLTQPQVEPELAVVTGDDGEVAAVQACLEVVDSVFTDYRFTLADNTADGSSAGLFVMGPVIDVSPAALASVTVELLVDGVTVESATGAAADGDPMRGVAWLHQQLSARGEALRPGDVVLTGGLTKAHPLPAGGEITAVFNDDVTLTVLGGQR
jgi:2-keto-4-pentenoate hydratase